MSQSKFASITSSLLARKGEATPWEEPRKRLLSWGTDSAQLKPEPPSFVTPLERSEPAFPDLPKQIKQPAAAGPKPTDPDKMKKCAVRVSCHDYERLGILAVKGETTRHHLMQEALKQFLVTGDATVRDKLPCASADQNVRRARQLSAILRREARPPPAQIN